MYSELCSRIHRSCTGIKASFKVGLKGGMSHAPPLTLLYPTGFNSRTESINSATALVKEVYRYIVSNVKGRLIYHYKIECTLVHLHCKISTEGLYIGKDQIRYDSIRHRGHASIEYITNAAA